MDASGSEALTRTGGNLRLGKLVRACAGFQGRTRRGFPAWAPSSGACSQRRKPCVLGASRDPERPGQGWGKGEERGGGAVQPPRAQGSAGKCKSNSNREVRGRAEFTPDRKEMSPVSAILGLVLIPYSVSASVLPTRVPQGIRGVRCPGWVLQGPSSSGSARGGGVEPCVPSPDGAALPGGRAAGAGGEGQAASGRAGNFSETHCCPHERCFKQRIGYSKRRTLSSRLDVGNSV